VCDDRAVGHRILRGDAHEYVERPGRDGEPPRLASDLTAPGGLQQSRARIWRYAPHTRGRRHADPAQEEVFVVAEGTLTMLLGEPPERVDLPPGSVVAVGPGVPLHVRNEGDDELMLFVYGAPPVSGEVEFLDDVETAPPPSASADRAVAAGSFEYVERPGRDDGAPRLSADVTTAVDLRESRARLFRLPPGARGTRHLEGVQEEVFFVLAGTLTMLLGEPPERVDVPRHSVVAVEPGTPLQLRNESDDELVVFVYGAPPVTGAAEYLDDVEIAPPPG
jgi:mannose-6-phosphate isomerase-like protein (cupin superfamily)